MILLHVTPLQWERWLSCWLHVKLHFLGCRFNRKPATQFTLRPHSDWDCCKESSRNRAGLGNSNPTFGSRLQLHHLWENTEPDSQLFSNICYSTQLLCQPHLLITPNRSCLSICSQVNTGQSASDHLLLRVLPWHHPCLHSLTTEHLFHLPS